MRGQSGVTLTEMFVVLAVIGILTAASLPLIQAVVPGFKSRGAAEQVVELLRTARQNAIATTAVYRVVFSPTVIQTICTDGVPSGNVCPPNRPPDTAEAVLEGATVSAAPGEMRFDPKGAAITGSGTVTVSYPGGASWQVVVSPPGRVRACEGSCS
jgi:prepilin-type N-terminal cleavage/methylation domain-containing protein